MDTTNSSEKPQRRVEDRKPAEVIDWAAPGAPAVPLSPAATSGDAPADLAVRIREAVESGIVGLMANKGMLIAAANEIDRLARIERAAAPAPAEKKAYGPDNPPRLRKDGESVQDYRIAMGWDAPPASPATASGDDLPPLPSTQRIGENHLGMIFGYTAEQMKSYARAAVSAATKPTSCVLPPPGWNCTRAPGHEGPCAAVPTEVCADDYTPERFAIYQHGVEDGKLIARGMERYKAGIAARDAATKPTADLSKLDVYAETDSGMEVVERGTHASEFYGVADVDALLATKPAGVPEGFVLMPKRLTQAMRDVLTEGEWEWPDFLAAAEVITEDEYNQLIGNDTLAAPTAAPAIPPENEVQAEEAKLYRDLTGEVLALGYQGLVDAVQALKAAPADQADKLERVIMEKRIELVPEYEGGWRANVYRDSDEPQATAAGTTPSAAVELALKSSATQTTEGAGK